MNAAMLMLEQSLYCCHSAIDGANRCVRAGQEEPSELTYYKNTLNIRTVTVVPVVVVVVVRPVRAGVHRPVAP